MSEIKISFDSKVTFIKLPDDKLTKRLEVKSKVKDVAKGATHKIKSFFNHPLVKVSSNGEFSNVYLDTAFYEIQGVHEIEIYCKHCGVSVKRSFAEMERKLNALNDGAPVDEAAILNVTYPYQCICELATRTPSFYRFNYRS